MGPYVDPEQAGLFETSGRPSLGPGTDEFSQDQAELAQERSVVYKGNDLLDPMPLPKRDAEHQQITKVLPSNVTSEVSGCSRQTC